MKAETIGDHRSARLMRNALETESVIPKDYVWEIVAANKELMLWLSLVHVSEMNPKQFGVQENVQLRMTVGELDGAERPESALVQISATAGCVIPTSSKTSAGQVSAPATSNVAVKGIATGLTNAQESHTVHSK